MRLLLTAAVAVGVWVFVAKHNPIVERASPTRLWGYLGIWLLPILAAMLLALFVRFFLLQPFHVPSGAMKPTLQVGEFFVVNKSSFGYSKASFIYPFTRMPVDGRIFDSPPERGDVVVFKNAKDGNKDYVERLIGLPGDEIQMIGGVLHINGELVKKEFIETRENTCGGGGGALTYRETLGNGVSYLVQECSGNDGGLDNVGPYLVPEGHYFMLGDNRDQSQDSRIMSAVGYIPYENLVGKALIREQ